MALIEQLKAVLQSHGFNADDMTRLTNGLKFDLDQMAVRNALNCPLSNKDRQAIRTRLLRGESVPAIVDTLS